MHFYKRKPITTTACVSSTSCLIFRFEFLNKVKGTGSASLGYDGIVGLRLRHYVTCWNRSAVCHDAGKVTFYVDISCNCVTWQCEQQSKLCNIRVWVSFEQENTVEVMKFRILQWNLTGGFFRIQSWLSLNSLLILYFCLLFAIQWGVLLFLMSTLTFVWHTAEAMCYWYWREKQAGTLSVLDQSDVHVFVAAIFMDILFWKGVLCCLCKS